MNYYMVLYRFILTYHDDDDDDDDDDDGEPPRLFRFAKFRREFSRPRSSGCGTKGIQEAGRLRRSDEKRWESPHFLELVFFFLTFLCRSVITSCRFCNLSLILDVPKMWRTKTHGLEGVGAVGSRTTGRSAAIGAGALIWKHRAWDYGDSLW